MRIYSSRGMFLGNGDCCLEFIGNFTDYDGNAHGDVQLLPDSPPKEELTPEAEQLLATLANPTPRRLTGMLSR